MKDCKFQSRGMLLQAFGVMTLVLALLLRRTAESNLAEFFSGMLTGFSLVFNGMSVYINSKHIPRINKEVK